MLSESDFKEALRLLSDTVFGKACRFATSRQFRPAGETCREYKTWQQGILCRGCDVCEAKAFLAKYGIQE